MPTINAIIKAKKDQISFVEEALLKVSDNVKLNEPDTINFFVAKDIDKPNIFVTYERFLSDEAMEVHNNSDTVLEFMEKVKGKLDDEIKIIVCSEISIK